MKSAFFHLPELKQQIILNNAHNEFSNNNFENVSLAKIAQNCDISRASLYTYFKDKDDLYEYLVEGVFEKFAFNENVLNKTPDLSVAKAFFDFLIGFYHSENHKFVFQLLKNTTAQNDNFFHNKLKSKYIKLAENNTEKVTLFLEKNKNVIFLTISSLIFVAMRLFAEVIDIETAKREFEEFMMIIKKGIEGGTK